MKFFNEICLENLEIDFYSLHTLTKATFNEVLAEC